MDLFAFARIVGPIFSNFLFGTFIHSLPGQEKKTENKEKNRAVVSIPAPQRPSQMTVSAE